jgi:hypothetical protein
MLVVFDSGTEFPEETFVAKETLMMIKDKLKMLGCTPTEIKVYSANIKGTLNNWGTADKYPA